METRERSLDPYRFDTSSIWRGILILTGSVHLSHFLVQRPLENMLKVFKSSHASQAVGLLRARKIRHKPDFLCAGEDLNLHALRHTHLKRAWLPITTPAHIFLLSRTQISMPKRPFLFKSEDRNDRKPPERAADCYSATSVSEVSVVSAGTSASTSSSASGSASATTRTLRIWRRISLAAFSRMW